jgi:4-diphosphocytidyl-2-C-methyl-D-erythritol kinase
LVTPPLAVPTVAAFRAWDALGAPRGDNGNDLEPAALVVEPGLARWRDRIREATGQRPVLAGSGSTWFVAGDHADVSGALSPAQVVVTRTDRPD